MADKLEDLMEETTLQVGGIVETAIIETDEEGKQDLYDSLDLVQAFVRYVGPINSETGVLEYEIPRWDKPRTIYLNKHLEYDLDLPIAKGKNLFSIKLKAKDIGTGSITIEYIPPQKE